MRGWNKMDLEVIGCEDMNWIHLARRRNPLMASCEYVNGPSGSLKAEGFRNYLSGCELLKDGPWRELVECCRNTQIIYSLFSHKKQKWKDAPHWSTYSFQMLFAFLFIILENWFKITFRACIHDTL
jgi:hypothetical protein